MNWFTELWIGNGVAHTLLIYALVIAIGVILGKVKIFGVSLGVTFVLFCGILFGHLGFSVDAPTLRFIQEFGLILFIFSIGLQVGPSFFSSFKREGIQLNGIAMLIVALNVVVAFSIYFIVGNISITDLVGVMSGAVTNTPGLGAAQQAIIETVGDGSGTINESMSLGYAAAYPLGVVGIILSMVLLKAFFKINVAKEAEAIEREKEDSQLKPHVITYQVTNKLIYDIPVTRLHAIIDHNFTISRLKRADGTVEIPQGETVIRKDDVLRIVMSAHDQDIFDAIIGPHVDFDWQMETEPKGIVSKRIVITQNELNGRKIGSIRLHEGYKVNVTRVYRAGVELLASPNLALQLGDRLTVVGREEDLDRLGKRMGNSYKRLDHPNLFTMFLGIFLGILVGSIPISLPGMSIPMKLGLAGGPLIVAILIGRYGYKLKLVTYTTTATGLMLRELGLCLFLASVGIAAGGRFVETILSANGAMWVLYGFLITIIPLLIAVVVARGKLHLNYCTIMGLVAGATTDPPALGYANTTSGNDAPSVAYATVYPLTMFMRVLIAELIIILAVT
ncbi:MAG: putative transporter [Muribaculaceae bacterium]|nr:putative transporter [Muribaculaceae bacterium]